MMNPVHFSSQVKELKGGEGELIFSATIDPGWHVYSTGLGNDGPISATFNAVKMDGVETIGKLQAHGKEIKQYDKLFGMELRFFEKTVTFVQKIRFTKPDYDIDCYVEYGACNDESCIPPSNADLKKKGKVSEFAKGGKPNPRGNGPDAKGDRPPMPPGGFDGGPNEQRPPHMEGQMPPRPEDRPNRELETKTGEYATSSERIPDNKPDYCPDTVAASSSLSPINSQLLWQPVVNELRDMGGHDNINDHSLLYILLMGFIGGLLAVCMPCIWPIIPMTVSFFLKRAKTDNKKGIQDAIIYGLSIIVIYLGLGLLVTAFFGSDTLNAMSTNAIFNIHRSAAG